jgi:predicted DsbA family dithiol-disulfide isomerase
MRIDIFADTVCPWCFIGKRRLEEALAARPQPGMTVRWRTFQLNPAMPEYGMDRQTYLNVKFGGQQTALRVYETIRETGRGAGLDFQFDNIAWTPNTLKSHQLVHFAAEHGDQDALVERLFRMYFMEGADIGETEVLADAAEAVGLDRTAALAALDADDWRETVLREDEQAREAGIQGVPTFIFNGRYALSGAQDPKVLMQMFDLARESTLAAEPVE